MVRIPFLSLIGRVIVATSLGGRFGTVCKSLCGAEPIRAVLPEWSAEGRRLRTRVRCGMVGKYTGLRSGRCEASCDAPAPRL